MSDIDSDIASAAADIETQRARLEPAATDLITAASAWAPEEWERIVEKVVATSPDLVKAKQAKLPALKDQLRALQVDAKKVANDCFEPLLLHRTMSDTELREFARPPGVDKRPVYVSLPGPIDNRARTPMEQLAGAIGPALNEAGLLRDSSYLDDQGRYRTLLPEHPTVVSALDAYESVLKDFIRSLHAHARLVGQRASNEASQLWRDA